MGNKKLIDIDELRAELGFSENCDSCKRDVRECERDSHFSMYDFCVRLDIAIEDVLKRHGDGEQE